MHFYGFWTSAHWETFLNSIFILGERSSTYCNSAINGDVAPSSFNIRSWKHVLFHSWEECQVLNKFFLYLVQLYVAIEEALEHDSQSETDTIGWHFPSGHITKRLTWFSARTREKGKVSKCHLFACFVCHPTISSDIRTLVVLQGY